MADEPKPWDRLPDEPAKWFDRFDAYRLLGLSRTLVGAWRNDPGKGKERKGKEPPKQWYEASATWRWKERAEAWDAECRPTRQQQRLAELAAERADNLAFHRLQRKKAREALEALDPLLMTPADIVKMGESGVAGILKALEDPILEDQDAELDRMDAEDGVGE